MTAQEFLRDFQLLFIEKKVEAIAAYYSNKKYTTFVMNEIEEIIKKHDFKIQKEYFRIDAIGWSPRADLIEDTEDVHLSHHLWDLEVAVEHENDQHDWMDEVVKLAHIVCPLRVVIGYLPWKTRNKNPEYDMLNLKHVVKELKKLKCFENMAHGEFLVILASPVMQLRYKNFSANSFRCTVPPTPEQPDFASANPQISRPGGTRNPSVLWVSQSACFPFEQPL